MFRSKNVEKKPKIKKWQVVPIEDIGVSDKLSKTSLNCINKIVEFVGETSSLIYVSKGFYNLFRQSYPVGALLSYVAKGNQLKVEQIPDVKLLLNKADVTDFSDRTFKNITAYQYALWALDWRMVRAIEEKACRTPGAEGVELRNALCEQREKLSKEGISYTLQGKTFREFAFDPTPIFEAYQNFVDAYKTHDREKINAAWYALGEQQRLLPAHVIQEMVVKPRGPRTFIESKWPRNFDGYFHGYDQGDDLLNPSSWKVRHSVFPVKVLELTGSQRFELGVNAALFWAEKNANASWWRGWSVGSSWKRGIRFVDSVSLHRYVDHCRWMDSGDAKALIDLDNLKKLFRVRSQQLEQDPELKFEVELKSSGCRVS